MFSFKPSDPIGLKKVEQAEKGPPTKGPPPPPPPVEKTVVIIADKTVKEEEEEMDDYNDPDIHKVSVSTI